MTVDQLIDQSPGEWRPLVEQVADRCLERGTGCLLYFGWREPKGEHCRVKLPGGQGAGSSLPRLIYMIFVGPVPEGRRVFHRCRCSRCISPEHLYTVEGYSVRQLPLTDNVTVSRPQTTWPPVRKEEPMPEEHAPHNATEFSAGNLLKYLALLQQYGPVVEQVIGALTGLANIHAGDAGHLPAIKTWLPGNHEAEFDIGYKILK